MLRRQGEPHPKEARPALNPSHRIPRQTPATSKREVQFSVVAACPPEPSIDHAALPMTPSQRLRREIRDWWRALLRAIPGETGCAVRRRLYGFQAAGPGTRVLSGVIVFSPERMRIGADVGISSGCQFNANGGIVLGDHVRIGPGTIVWSQNHEFQNPDVPIALQGYERAAVTVEDDVWIAAGCIILPGVTLARGTVVAAGAVVTKSTEPYAIVAGVPARQVGHRGSPLASDA